VEGESERGMGNGERGYRVSKTYPLGTTMNDSPARLTTYRVSDSANRLHYARCSGMVPTDGSTAATSALSSF